MGEIQTRESPPLLWTPLTPCGPQYLETLEVARILEKSAHPCTRVPINEPYSPLMANKTCFAKWFVDGAACLEKEGRMWKKKAERKQFSPIGLSHGPCIASRNFWT
ncbi:hypothetical protein TNCV_3691811 [Trichonephila clavipes]|nr:hypothetical protein TNCV_3691811 [Trichonephila clavipes]